MGNVTRRDASRRFLVLMLHSDATIMRNVVFMLDFLANMTPTSASDTKRHRTVHVNFYVHARGTSTIFMQPPPQLWPLVFPSPKLIHHKCGANGRPTMMRPSLWYRSLAPHLDKQPPADESPQHPCLWAAVGLGGRQALVPNAACGWEGFIDCTGARSG